MEDLSVESETLGFNRWASIEQCYAVAQAIAGMQYSTDTDELKPWCMEQMTSYFDDFYTTHLVDSLQAIKQLPGTHKWLAFKREILGIDKLLPKLKPILKRSFGNYSLFTQASAYGKSISWMSLIVFRYWSFVSWRPSSKHWLVIVKM